MVETLELPFGNTERVLAEIEEFTAGIVEDGKIPLMIGGEHLVTLGAVCAVAKNILIYTSFISMPIQI